MIGRKTPEPLTPEQAHVLQKQIELARPPPLTSEHVKLVFEHTKHLTTLSAGSIVGLVTFYEKLSGHHWKAFIVSALIAFVVSIFLGLLGQIRTIDTLGQEQFDRDTQGLFVGSWLTFAIGMASLCGYAARNLL